MSGRSQHRYRADRLAAIERLHRGELDVLVLSGDAIVESGARFLVFGRTMSGGFQTLGQLHLPEPLLAICREVREDEFRHDVSSSEIRRANLPTTDVAK